MTDTDSSNTWSQRWRELHDHPGWWQRLLLFAALPPLLLVAVVALSPRIESLRHQAPNVVVPLHTESTKPGIGTTETAASRTVVAPTARAAIVATATPMSIATVRAIALPVQPTATLAPRLVALTITCLSSVPGFCEFLDGASISRDGSACTLTLGVWALVGQATEPVSCSVSTSSASFVGANVPCSTNSKGTCVGDVATQK